MGKDDKKKTKETKPVKDRAYYKEIFYQFWNQYNYIPVPDMRGDGKEYLIDELDEKYPPFWFMTSHGRVFSVEEEDKMKQLLPLPNPGCKGKRRWEYQYYKNGKRKHAFIHQMVAEHCCENPYAKDVKVVVHHITPTNKFSWEDCFLANQACNLQWIPKSPHKEITYKFSVKEPEDILKEKMEKVLTNKKEAPLWINFPTSEAFNKHIFDSLQSMQQQTAPIDAKLYEIKDVYGECYRNHDVSYRELKNVDKIELIEDLEENVLTEKKDFIVTEKYIFIAEDNGDFLEKNKVILDNAVDNFFADCVSATAYNRFEFNGVIVFYKKMASTEVVKG